MTDLGSVQLRQLRWQKRDRKLRERLFLASSRPRPIFAAAVVAAAIGVLAAWQWSYQDHDD